MNNLNVPLPNLDIITMKSPLQMEWKTEPESPQSAEESWAAEDVTDLELTAFYDDTINFKSEADINISLESKAEIASKLLEGLDQLEDLDEWIKEEPFSNWLEEKTLFIPIFDDVAPQSPAAYAVKSETKQALQNPTTETLLQEFETVFNDVTHGPLTPPQSPPTSNINVLVTLQPVIAPPQSVIEQQYQKISNVSFMYPGTPQPDVDQELAAVDELVRTRAEDMVDYNSKEKFDDFSSNSSSSGFGDDSSCEDPEWMPESIQAPASPPMTPLKKQGRKRSKPYARVSVEDKKSRKKEQNKNAATRYRQKKKAEVEVILDEEKGLQDKNESLQASTLDLQREIKYLKGLMRDLFKAKGLID